MMGLPEAAPGLFAWYAPGFSDPLGDRLLLFDNTEDRPLELLRLCPSIATAPGAESLLRARMQALATLADDRFARVCRVDRLPQPGGGLAIVSEHVEGQRLSEFLALVSQRGGRVGADLTISVIAKLLTALGVMHRRGPDLAHGALAPERLVVAPGGRVVITEHVLAPVLEELPFDRDALWQRLRVALPPPPAPRVLDQQTDLFQVAFVAIAMLLGRPLHADEDPPQAPSLLREASTRAREAGWDPARWLDFERWLSRALCITPEERFADTIEAGLALQSLTDAAGRSEWERVAVPEPLPPPALPPASEPVEPPRGRRALPMGSRAIDTLRRTRRRRRQLFASALALALGVPGVYLGARALMRGQPPPRDLVQAKAKAVVPPPAPAVAPARLDVRTDPPGARVFVDSQPRGVTPMAVMDLPRGQHQVRLESDGHSVTQAVILEPGRTATLFVPFHATGAPAAGWLSIAAPVELQVFEDDRLLGSSRSDRIMLPSGRHTLSLVNEPIGFRATREIQVPLGKTAALDLTMPNGRADINAAPWAEVWIDGEKAGDTPLAAFPLPPGRHTVIFKHPRLGERSVDCFVTLREPLRLSADLRK